MAILNQKKLAEAFGVTWKSRKDGLIELLTMSSDTMECALSSTVKFNDLALFNFLSYIFTALDSAGYMLGQYDEKLKLKKGNYYWHQLKIGKSHSLYQSYEQLKSKAFTCRESDNYTFQELWNVMKVLISINYSIISQTYEYLYLSPAKMTRTRLLLLIFLKIFQFSMNW